MKGFELCFLTELCAMTTYYFMHAVGFKFDLLSLNLKI